MQCPICGYLLDHLDTECPRCKVLRERGIDPATAKTDIQLPADGQVNNNNISADKSSLSASFRLANARPAKSATPIIWYIVEAVCLILIFVGYLAIKNMDNTAKGNTTIQTDPNQVNSELTAQQTQFNADIHLHKVDIGMTTDQCRQAWGIPDKIKRTVNAYGDYEDWSYGDESELSFDNGILISIQE
jgi:hypothetical protein